MLFLSFLSYNILSSLSESKVREALLLLHEYLYVSLADLLIEVIVLLIPIKLTVILLSLHLLLKSIILYLLPDTLNFIIHIRLVAI